MVSLPATWPEAAALMYRGDMLEVRMGTRKSFRSKRGGGYCDFVFLAWLEAESPKKDF